MSIDIHVCISIDIQYVNRDTVCQSRYCMSIEILYVNRDTVCQSRYCMSIEILYVNRDTVCRSAVIPDCSRIKIFRSDTQLSIIFYLHSFKMSS